MSEPYKTATEAFEAIRRADAETERMRLRLEDEFQDVIARKMASFLLDSRHMLIFSRVPAIVGGLLYLGARLKRKGHGRRATKRWAVRPRQRGMR